MAPLTVFLFSDDLDGASLGAGGIRSGLGASLSGLGGPGGEGWGLGWVGGVRWLRLGWGGGVVGS